MWIRRRPYQEKWAELGRLDQVTSRTTQPIEAHVRPGPPAANLIVSSHLLPPPVLPKAGESQGRPIAKPGQATRGED